MHKEKKRISVSIRICIGICWLVLFGLLLRRDFFLDRVDMREIQALEQAESEEYQAIYFKKEKIGHVLNKYAKTENNNWLLEQSAFMRLNVAGSRQDIELNLAATLSDTNLLKDFDFTFHSPFYKMKATGEVTGNEVSYTLETGTNVITDTLSFESPPFLATSRRAYLLGVGIEPGTKRKVPWFDPFSLTGKESVVEYRGEESIRIGGRVHKLHHFVESFSGTRVNSWLNDAGVIVKEESPAGFVFIKEPKFKALEVATAEKDILDAVAVQQQGPMPDSFENLKSMSYQLTFPEGIDLDISGGRQQISNNTLTLTLETVPEKATQWSSNCDGARNTLSPTPYIQSESEEIQTLAETIASTTSNRMEKARLLGTWVYKNLEKRPVLGLPDALTTLQSKQGDCNEHSALFAALARAQSIPTRIVAGVTYHKEAFYYHAWNEVCLDDRWVSVDTTTNQFPADLSHIRLIIGEMQEQVKIGGLLGNLAIKPVQPDND